MIDYAAIQFPPARTLWGVRLEALQLGHWFALQRLGVFQGERVPGLGDLLTALVVCSEPCWVATPGPWRLRWLRLRAGLLQARHELFTLHWRPRWGVWTVPELELLEACSAFAAHLQAARQMPDLVPPKEASGRMPGTPLFASVKVALMSELRLSERDALRTPLVKAIFDVCAAREADGKLTIDNTPGWLMAALDKANELNKARRAATSQTPDAIPQPPST